MDGVLLDYFDRYPLPAKKPAPIPINVASTISPTSPPFLASDTPPTIPPIIAEAKCRRWYYFLLYFTALHQNISTTDISRHYIYLCNIYLSDQDFVYLPKKRCTFWDQDPYMI